MTGVHVPEGLSESTRRLPLWGAWTWDDEGQRAVYLGPDRDWAMQIAAWLEERGRPAQWGRLGG